MTRKQKNIIGVLLLGIVISIALYNILVYEFSCNSRDFRDDTYFAPGFSQEKFLSIQKDMPKDQVIQLLGQPLNTRNQSNGDEWLSYSVGGSANSFIKPCFTQTLVIINNNKVKEISMVTFTK